MRRKRYKPMKPARARTHNAPVKKLKTPRVKQI